ncbi:MAG: ribosome biogenesis GTPase Der [Myxococcales bacterium]
MTPIVAIVGRPNVGKSSLFNRLAGQRLAIVDDQPGVTRDRHYVDVLIHGRKVTLVDTGGFDPTTEDPMGQGIARQVKTALDEADVVLCVLDGSVPPTAPDGDAVKLLRRSGKRVVFVANKIDSSALQTASADLYSLGITEFVPISALHGRGIAELLAATVADLPTQEQLEESEPEPEQGVARITIIGRPNAGKSSLFNRLAGAERSLVDSAAGTTRDPVNTEMVFDGRRFHLVDTAGIRRRSRVTPHGVESASVFGAIRAIERTDAAIVLCDATDGIADQDLRLLSLCADRGRAIIVGLNKCDLLDKESRKQAIRQAEDALRFASWAKIVPVSAKTGYGLSELMMSAHRACEQMHHRVGTGELNRFFEHVLANHAPPTHGGRAPRIYYITQASTSPPTFVAISNAPDHIATSYRRYVSNQIRKAFGFESVPLVVHYRPKDRSEERS